MKYTKTFKAAMLATAAVALGIGAHVVEAASLTSLVEVEVASITTVTTANDLDMGTYILNTDGVELASVVIAPSTGVVTNDTTGDSTMILLGGTSIPQVGQVSVAGALATTVMNVSHDPATVELSCEGQGSCIPSSAKLELAVNSAATITTDGAGGATVNIAGTLRPAAAGTLTAGWFDETYTGTFTTSINY